MNFNDFLKIKNFLINFQSTLNQMNQEDEKWSLEMKMIAYRRQIESANVVEKKLNKQIEILRREKAEVYDKITQGFKEKMSLSLPYTVPIGFINMILMKSLCVIPLTIFFGSFVPQEKFKNVNILISQKFI